jgi:hypothetical protein
MAAKATPKPEPEKKENLGKPLLIRVTPSERVVFEALAKRDSRSLSAWIRLACIDKARSLGAKI